jgi:integrase
MALTVGKTDVGAKPVGRKPNAAYRSREHLTEDEVVRLVKAARGNRRGARDAALIFLMYRHGLRVSEACARDWSAIDFTAHEVWRDAPEVH